MQSGQNFALGGFGARGVLGAFGAHGLLRAAPLATNCWPEAPRGGGGAGVVGVLGPAESPPPPWYTLHVANKTLWSVVCQDAMDLGIGGTFRERYFCGLSFDCDSDTLASSVNSRRQKYDGGCTRERKAIGSLPLGIEENIEATSWRQYGCGV